MITLKELAERRCDTHYQDTSALSETAYEHWLSVLPCWSVERTQNTPSLVCHFSFNDFSGALAFANVLGDVANEQNHHPELVIGWGRVTVRWTTSELGGLHENDFICAAKTQRLWHSIEQASIGSSAS